MAGFGSLSVVEGAVTSRFPQSGSLGLGAGRRKTLTNDNRSMTSAGVGLNGARHSGIAQDEQRLSSKTDFRLVSGKRPCGNRNSGRTSCMVVKRWRAGSTSRAPDDRKNCQVVIYGNGCMILDLERSVRPDANFDVCLVGAGAAGLFLAMQLVKHGRRVLVLAAGGMRWFERRSQALKKSEIAGLPFNGAHSGRFRTLGASTAGPGRSWNSMRLISLTHLISGTT
jgi:hypothetical protein